MIEQTKKLKSINTHTLFKCPDRKMWISAYIGQCEIWRKSKKKKLISLPGYIKGRLAFSKKEKKITSGYWDYNLKSKKLIYRKDLIQNILSTYSSELISNGLEYFITDSDFDKEKNRLVLSLRYQPSRRKHIDHNFKIPHNIIALLNYKTGNVIKLLDTDGFTLASNLFFTSDYLIVLTDELKAWEKTSGKKLNLPKKSTQNALHVSSSIFENNILVTQENGKINKINLSSLKTSKLTSSSSIVKVYEINKEEHYVVEHEDEGIFYVDLKKTSLENKDFPFILKASINDVYFNSNENKIYLAIETQDNYSIRTFKVF